MSIYTYNQSKAICECLEIPFEENPILSDQELNKIPHSSKLGQGLFPILKGNNHAKGHIPWNKDKSCKGLIIGNKFAGLNGIKTRYKKGTIPHNKNKSLTSYTKQQIADKISQYCWINNGEINKKQLKVDDVPNGWSRGRIMNWKRNMKKVSV